MSMSMNFCFNDEVVVEKWLTFCKKFLEKEEINWNDLSNEEQQFFKDSWSIPEIDEPDNIWNENSKFVVESFISKKKSIEFKKIEPEIVSISISNKLYDKFNNQVLNKNIIISSDDDILDSEKLINKFPGLSDTNDITTSMLLTYISPNVNCSWEKKSVKIPSSYIDIIFNETVAIDELISVLHLLVYDNEYKKITFFYNDDCVYFRIFTENIDQASFEDKLLYVFYEHQSEEEVTEWDLDIDNIQIPEYTINMFVPWKPIMVQYETISKIFKQT